MSTLIVKIKTIDSIAPHLNSDNLELATIGGWQCVVRKGQYKQGERVVFIPPDAVLTKEFAVRMGVDKYLAGVKGDDTKLRVKATRLRGEPSYGLTFPPADIGIDPNDDSDLAEKLGITKWEPPVVEVQGNAAREIMEFPRYTNIEHYANFSDVFAPDDYIIITEKIHGTNFRAGLIEYAEVDTDRDAQLVWMAGSHNVRRKEEPNCKYWQPILTDLSLRTMIIHLQRIFDANVIVYGEIYGVQDMKYGLNGRTAYALFDIMVNYKYLDYAAFKKYCELFRVPMVPIIYEGYYSHEIVKQHTDGPTTMCDPDKAGKFKGREGVVIRPIEERSDPMIGRVILKSISADYLARKGGTDGH